jgi:uncharacterized protein YjiS (DUF1127 family)
MSTATLTRFYCSLCDTITNFFKGFVTESRFDPDWDSKGYKALSSLSDYELRDIGITRGDINHICRGGKVHRGSF